MLKTYSLTSPQIEKLKAHPQFEASLKVSKVIIAAGGQVLWAGGVVRDLFVDKFIKDIDVVTDLLPDKIQTLFPKNFDIGKKFGIINVVEDSKNIEVATFRKDGNYQDGRHPNSVTFCTPEEDALRRDFRMNGLFLDPFIFQVNDYVGGLSDINRKLIQCIGESEKRFQEDGLRILRGLRFAAQLGFSIEEDTFSKMKLLMRNLERISKERIKVEMEQWLTGEYRDGSLVRFQDSGILKVLFNVDSFNLAFLQNGKNTELQWAGFILAVAEGKEFAEEFLFHYKFSNLEKETIRAFRGLIASEKISKEEDYILYLKRCFDLRNGSAFRKFSYLLEPRFQVSFAEVVKDQTWLEAKVKSHDLMKFFQNKDLGNALKLAYIKQIVDLISDKEKLIEIVCNTLSPRPNEES